VEVKRLVDNYESFPRLPTRATDGAAGYDLYTPNEVQLVGGAVTPVRLGIAVAIPPGYVGLIKDRSSLGKKGIHVFGGVIDSDYRGEVVVLLYNSPVLPGSPEYPDVYTLNRGDRIAQLVVVPCYQGMVVECNDLPPTQRGAGGFGSTGV